MMRIAAGIYPLLLAALAGMPGAALAADDLGRLFTTPGERAQIDAARQAAPVAPLPVTAPQPRSQGVQPVESKSALTLRGLVKRDAGRSTAWVNDINTYEGDLDSPYRAVDKSGIAADQVTLKLPDGQSSIKIKVGQTYEPVSTHIRELGAEPEPAVAPAPVEAEVNDE